MSAETNRVELIYVEEVTEGTTPSTPSTTALRMAGESLNYNIQTIQSNEIRKDRNLTDLIQVAADVSGDINYELSYGTFDDFLRALLMSSGWSTNVAVSASDIAADATGFTSTTTDFTTENIDVGQAIEVRGFTDSTIDGYYRVVSVTANDLNVEPVPPATEAAGQTITMAGSYIKNESTVVSFSIEKAWSDVTQFLLMAGMRVASGSMTLEAQSVANGAFSLLGRSAALAQSSVDATPTAANTNDVMNAVNNIPTIVEGASALGTTNLFRRLTWNASNNLRQQYAIGQLALAGVGAGRFDVGGQLSAYFDDETLFDKFINGTQTDLMYVAEDAAGNAYIFDWPTVEFESSNVVASGPNDDSMVDLGWRALYDSDLGATMAITKVPA